MSVAAATRARAPGGFGVPFWVVLAGFLVLSIVAHGQETTNGPIKPYLLLSADEVTFDDATGIATAIGHVEIAHGERVLRADRVSYDKKGDKITATGNVAVLEPNGDVMFADSATFTDGLKDGFALGFRMLMTDNSRLAAAGATRTGGVITRLNKAVYSPCNLCKEDPKRAPLWRIRAVRVVHDAEEKQIEYRDAFLDFFGVPVAYLPYLSHPDPTVKRRSGVLAPGYSSDSEFGLVLTVPYFWAIDQSGDATVTPIIMTNEASVLAGEYRRRFARGELQMNGSITRPDRREGETVVDGRQTRGHLIAQGTYHFDPVWRGKFQLQSASDDTYLRRYELESPSDRTLTTSFNVEGFKGHNYAQVSGYRFQGLRETDDPGETPLILPFGEYSYVSHPRDGGSYFTVDTSLLGLHRDEGADSRRLSFAGGWHLPYTSPAGDIYELSALVQADGYWVGDVDTGVGTKNGLTGRIFPQLMLKWRYPFVRREKTATQLVEPVAAVVLGPTGGNPSEIPNEDSQDLEFDDTNLFSANRFTGVDRVEGGQRFIYGLNWGLYGDQGGVVEAFLGQSYRLQAESIFAEGSGLRDQASDLVGRVRVSPGEMLDLLYRFRVDPDGFESARNEVRLIAGPPQLRGDLNYLFVSEKAGTGEFGNREEATLNLSSRLSRYWTAHASIRQDLTNDGGTLSEGIGVTYRDECFIFVTRFTRSFTRDRDLRPSDTLFFQLIFKHLGEFASTG